jgi:hypothetical protein
VEALRTFGVAFDMSDTGTGKTYAACKVAEELGCHHVVVVCPNIVERKWKALLGSASEGCCDTWMVFPYSLLTQSASKNGLFKYTEGKGRPMYINGYGKLVKNDDLPDLKCKIKRGTKLAELLSFRTLLILDETHKAKNSATQISKATVELAAQVRRNEGWVLHVSATPFDQVFQLPQYMHLIGAHDFERAQRLVAAATPMWEDPRKKQRCCWDAEQVMKNVVRRRCYGSLEDALYALSKSGSDVGKNWAAIQAFNIRLMGFIPGYPMDDIRMCNQIFNPTGVYYDAASRIFQYMKKYNSARDCDLTALECIMWPFAIEYLDADVELALKVVDTLLPMIMFRMTMPDYGFKRFDVDLFTDVDTSMAVAELAYLPDYRALNASCPPAPLVSPDGKYKVGEAVAVDWDSPEWKLGKERPVEVWGKIMRDSGNAPSAKAVHDMCLAALDCRLRMGAAGYIPEGEDVEELERKVREHTMINLEAIKVPVMISIVKHILETDPGSKVVVMFNYLAPLEQFKQACISDIGCAPLCITGRTPVRMRAEMIEKWTQRVLLCTTAVINEGIDLHDTKGDEHRYTVMTPAPNAVAGQQALGRIHRAGVRSHAVNCVVYGGTHLGGPAEKRLIARLGTKKATMGFMEPTHALDSTDKFKAFIRDVHGGGVDMGRASLPPPSDSETVKLEDALRFSNMTWWKLELRARMWRDIKRMQTVMSGLYGSTWKQVWEVELTKIVLDDEEPDPHDRIESGHRHHLNELQLRRNKLKMSKDIVSRYDWVTMWPTFVYKGFSQGYAPSDQEAFKSVTYV